MISDRECKSSVTAIRHDCHAVALPPLPIGDESPSYDDCLCIILIIFHNRERDKGRDTRAIDNCVTSTDDPYCYSYWSIFSEPIEYIGGECWVMRGSASSAPPTLLPSYRRQWTIKFVDRLLSSLKQSQDPEAL